MIDPDALVVRAGVMGDAFLDDNIAAVREEYGRPGLCVKVALEGPHQLRDDKLVPHAKICLSTPRLLAEHGLDELEATNDQGDRFQFTLWVPSDLEPASLRHLLRAAFRGPFVKREVTNAYSTEDLRGLQRPGS